MTDPVTIPAGSYASVSVDPDAETAHVFAADVPYVGTGDIDCTVDAKVTQQAVRNAIAFLTNLLPTLPE